MTDDLLSFLRENAALPPYHHWLRPEISGIDPATGTVTARLAVRPEFARAPGEIAVHGGILMALADLAGHTAVAARLRHTVPTIDIRVDFLRLAMGPMLTAEATPVKIGRTIAVVDIRILDGRNSLACVARGSYGTMER